MSSLWLPPSERERREEAAHAYAAEVDRQAGIRSVQQEWDRLLADIDPRLRLRKAQEGASLPGLKPGYWYVIRHQDVGPPHLICHEGENGEYRDPDAELLDKLRHWDTWDDRVQRDRDRRHERIRTAYERQKEREREARLDEALVLLKALESPSIRFGGKGWTAKAGARKDR